MFFVLPYYVNDLDKFPLSEVAAGFHDPKDLWPHNDTGPLPFVVGFGGALTIYFGPAVAVVALGWALFRLSEDGSNLDLRGRAPLAMAVAVSLGVLVWRFSAFGVALTQWWLD